MIDQKSALYKFYISLTKTNRVGTETPPAQAYYISAAIYEKTGEQYSAEHVWVSLWLEARVNPDEIKIIPEWYVEKYMGGRYPDVAVLKVKLWKKYRDYLLHEKGIDLPF